MFCCRDCNLETQATFTTVLFIDRMAQQRAMVLERYAQKHLRGMMGKEEARAGGKENVQGNRGKRDSMSSEKKTIRSIKTAKGSQSQLTEHGVGDDCQTGRFKYARAAGHRASRDSISRKDLESKTTSFGTLASRTSLVKDLLSRAEITSLQEELETLRGEEMALLREKAQRDNMYNRELRKINGMKDDVGAKSSQRQDQLYELRQLFQKKKQSGRQHNE